MDIDAVVSAIEKAVGRLSPNQKNTIEVALFQFGNDKFDEGFQVGLRDGMTMLRNKDFWFILGLFVTLLVVTALWSGGW